jgi:hypothetical protein
MTVRRSLARRGYSEQEKRVLLTGVPVSCASTRFGHPNTGWNVEEIRAAWAELRDELLVEFESPAFDDYRSRGPFAERILT